VSARTIRLIGVTAAAGLTGTILAANAATAHLGFIPVGFGLTATAGTLAAGLALGLRDIVQDTLGRRAVVALILVGAALSWWVAPALAVASAVAFLVSELADFAVYTPLRGRAAMGGRRWAGAVAASNVVGAVVDTVLFGIAFGTAAITPAALAGQLLGKGWATLALVLAVPLIREVARRAVPRDPIGA
jgi:uncharacterized PurR-regulated membrane protein YhhQ (DUF165 family)